MPGDKGPLFVKPRRAPPSSQPPNTLDGNPDIVSSNMPSQEHFEQFQRKRDAERISTLESSENFRDGGPAPVARVDINRESYGETRTEIAQATLGTFVPTTEQVFNRGLIFEPNHEQSQTLNGWAHPQAISKSQTGLPAGQGAYPHPMGYVGYHGAHGRYPPQQHLYHQHQQQHHAAGYFFNGQGDHQSFVYPMNYVDYGSGLSGTFPHQPMPGLHAAPMMYVAGGPNHWDNGGSVDAKGDRGGRLQMRLNHRDREVCQGQSRCPGLTIDPFVDSDPWNPTKARPSSKQEGKDDSEEEDDLRHDQVPGRGLGTSGGNRRDSPTHSTDSSKESKSSKTSNGSSEKENGRPETSDVGGDLSSKGKAVGSAVRNEKESKRFAPVGLSLRDPTTFTGFQKCLVTRDRSSLRGRLFPTYQLFSQEVSPGTPPSLVMIAQKESASRTSNYRFFDVTKGVPTRLSKKARNYLGKLRGNFNRDEYAVYAPDKSVLGSVCYDKNDMLTQFRDGAQPRRMAVLVPNDVLKTSMTPEERLQSIVDAKITNGKIQGGPKVPLDAGSDDAKLADGKQLQFASKDPVFEKGSYRLNFHGRVKLPSVKNFQLVPPTDITSVWIQFGKVNDDNFHLDYKAPFSPMLAFAIAVSQFDY